MKNACLGLVTGMHDILALGSKELVGSDQEGGGLKLFSITFFVPGFR